MREEETGREREREKDGSEKQETEKKETDRQREALERERDKQTDRQTEKDKNKELCLDVPSPNNCFKSMNRVFTTENLVSGVNSIKNATRLNSLKERSIKTMLLRS